MEGLEEHQSKDYKFDNFRRFCQSVLDRGGNIDNLNGQAYDINDVTAKEIILELKAEFEQKLKIEDKIIEKLFVYINELLSKSNEPLGCAMFIPARDKDGQTSLVNGYTLFDEQYRTQSDFEKEIARILQEREQKIMQGNETEQLLAKVQPVKISFGNNFLDLSLFIDSINEKPEIKLPQFISSTTYWADLKKTQRTMIQTWKIGNQAIAYEGPDNNEAGPARHKILDPSSDPTQLVYVTEVSFLKVVNALNAMMPSKERVLN